MAGGDSIVEEVYDHVTQECIQLDDGYFPREMYTGPHRVTNA